MNTLTKLQAEMMFRSTDKQLFHMSFSPYEPRLSGDMAWLLESFHCDEVYQLNLDDDFFKGIRANTFCIEVGWSEQHFEEKDEQERHPTLYLVTANHKGTRMSAMYAMEEGVT